jgi:hypothetical protein
MDKNISDPYLSPRELTSGSSHQRYLQPEPSDEPIFKTPKSKEAEKSSLNTLDMRQSTELNSSSLQVSTQQSLNFKKSFSIISPKRSIPSTPLLLANKLKEIQNQSMTMKLAEQLKDLEDESERRKTEGMEPEKLLNLEKDDKIHLDFQMADAEAELILENEEHPEIPQLKWCAFCSAEVATEVEFVNNNKTFWSSVGIFLAGGVFGCFLVPYMTNYCKGVKIVCHKCKRPLSYN